MAWPSATGYDMYGHPIQYDAYGNPISYPGYAMAPGYPAAPVPSYDPHQLAYSPYPFTQSVSTGALPAYSTAYASHAPFPEPAPPVPAPAPAPAYPPAPAPHYPDPSPLSSSSSASAASHPSAAAMLMQRPASMAHPPLALAARPYSQSTPALPSYAQRPASLCGPYPPQDPQYAGYPPQDYGQYAQQQDPGYSAASMMLSSSQGGSFHGMGYSTYDYGWCTEQAYSQDVYQQYYQQATGAATGSPASIAMAAAIQGENYSLLSHGLVVDSAPAQAPAESNQLSDDELSRLLEKPVQAVLYHAKDQTKQVHLALSPGGVHLHVDGQTLFLRDIDAIRFGCKTAVFLSRRVTPDPSQCFSIQHGLKTIDLELRDPQDFSLWTGGLIRLVAGLREVSSDYALVKGAWFKMGKETLLPAEAQSVLKTLNLNVTLETINQLAPTCDSFSFSSFIPLMRRCRERPEIKALFVKYAGGEVMNAAQLQTFVHAEQKDTEFTLEHANQTIAQFGDAQQQTIRCEGFEAFLTSPRWNSYESPIVYQVHHDMTRPLHEYFISSSHNTYLEGNQLTGKSSTEMYVRVLKTGCRCIELDCWDGTDGEPIITHGKTLTSKILFEDVLKVIKKFAFFASEYPLILSIENHTTQLQQARMGTLFEQYLGDLMAPSFRYGDSACKDHLWSPEQLKGRILLKGPIGSDTPVAVDTSDVAFELSRLIHLGPVPFSLDSLVPPYRMTSLSENKLKTIPPQELLRCTQSRLIRFYPGGARTDSSNPDPIPAWITGCQMIALNYQDPGLPLLLNFVKFSDNGGCGYLLKPPALRNDPRFNPYSLSSAGAPFPELTVRVLSARQLPTPKEAQVIAKEAAPSSLRATAKNFLSKVKTKVSKAPPSDLIQSSYVVIEVHGIPIDCKKVRTAHSPNGHSGPNWDEVFSFVFRCVDLSIITFSIVNAGTNTKLCHAGISASCIRSGYRVIPLREPSLKYLPMTDLFCQFSIR